MIWNFTIRRPVLTIVVFIAMAVFGLWAWTAMPLRENPDIEFPVVSVNVVFPGAEPEVIETEIIDPLEEEINTAEGLKRLESTARAQVGTITAEFELWRDVDIATQDVRDRVNRALRELPDGIERPIVRQIDPDAQPVMWIALTGDRRWDAVSLSTYADETLREHLQNIRGVGRVVIGGERRYAVRVRLDPEKLKARNLEVKDVIAAIRANNVDLPAGRIESEQREFLVKMHGQFSSPEPINRIIVAVRRGGAIRIEDVGEAYAGVENDRQSANFVGRTAIGLGIVKRSGANTVALASAVRERMSELAGDFPPGLEYTIATDNSEYIEASIRDLVVTIFLATGLVVIVVLFFLRSGWGTLITSLSIPVSLLAGVAVMSWLGFSLNTLTMLGLILAIGIVVDDAVVILESAKRKLDAGSEARPAARVGTTEVAFPAIANTMALAAVFIPVAFTAGIIGRFFYEFSLTVAVTVFASTLTALTLTPMLCSRLLKRTEREGRLATTARKSVDRLGDAYGWLVGKAFAHPAISILAALAVFAATGYLATRLSTEFLPTVDRSQFLVSYEMPEGATLRATQEQSDRIGKVLRGRDDVQHYFSAIGLSRGEGPGRVNNGIAFVRLVPRDQRELHQSEVAQQLREQLKKIPLGRAYVIEFGQVGLGAGAEVQFALQHPDLDELARRQESLMGWMRRQPLFTGVNSDLKMNNPEVNIRPRRDKANDAGITVRDINETFQLLLGEPDISEIEREAERYEVIPEIVFKGDMVPEMIQSIYLRNADGNMVSAGDLLRSEVGVGPSAIHHYNRIRSATISASTPPGSSLGDAVNALQTRLDQQLPRRFDYVFAGRTQDFRESFRNLLVTIAMAVVFIYLVLAGQFESFLQPLIILLALPLAWSGAFAALWIFNMPLGIVSFIGLIMLTGMATKNAILLIDYTNVLVARGRSLREAAREASAVRFRPVVMTTVSTVLGLLPIALGFGSGGEARAPMGVAVAFGLTVTTILTLVFLPVVYVLVGEGVSKLSSRLGSPQEDDE
ncbi:MAG: efflux RND transporter permease subunit [Phycisphaerae bacterium]